MTRKTRKVHKKTGARSAPASRPYAQLNVRVPLELVDRLDGYLERVGQFYRGERSKLIRKLLDTGLDQLEARR